MGGAVVYSPSSGSTALSERQVVDRFTGLRVPDIESSRESDGSVDQDVRFLWTDIRLLP